MTLASRQKEWARWLIAGFPEYDLPPWPLVSACASAGNVTQENLARPVTTGRKDHGSDGGFQWRLNRLEPGPGSLKGWCSSHNIPWNTIRSQAAFHMFELKHGEAGPYGQVGGGTHHDRLYADLLAGTKSLATLTTNINRQYERSADSEAINNKRIRYARDTWNLMTAQPKPSVVKTAAPATGAIAAGAVLWTWLESGNLTHAIIAVMVAVSAIIAGTVLMHMLPDAVPPTVPAIPPRPQPLFPSERPPVLVTPLPTKPSTPSLVAQLEVLRKQRDDAIAAVTAQEKLIAEVIAKLGDALKTEPTTPPPQAAQHGV